MIRSPRLHARSAMLASALLLAAAGCDRDQTAPAPRPHVSPRANPAARRAARPRPRPRKVVIPPAPRMAPTPKVTGSEVQFKTRPRKVGDTRTCTVTTATFHAVAGRAWSRKTAHQARQRVEMVTGSVATKREVTWSKQETVTITGGKTRREAGALTGKTLVVESGIGKLEVTDPAGHRVLGRLGRIAVREADRLRGPDRLAEALPRTPLKAGEPLEGLSAMLSKELRARYSREPRERVTDARVQAFVVGRVQLAGVDAAVVRIAATVTINQLPRTVLTLRLAGWMAISLDGVRLLRSVQGGPIDTADRKNAGWTLRDARLTYPTPEPR